MASKEEKIELWALVNELCRVTQVNPDEFNPAKHLPYAQELVNSLDVKLGVSLPLELSYKGEPDEFGNETSFDYGKDEQRLGHYVITKHKIWPKKLVLNLEHFWDRDKHELFEQGSISTNIIYGKEDKKVKAIRTDTLEPYFLNFNFFGRRVEIQVGRSKINYFYKK